MERRKAETHRSVSTAVFITSSLGKEGRCEEAMMAVASANSVIRVSLWGAQLSTLF
jgi:hypothetical protein